MQECNERLLLGNGHWTSGFGVMMLHMKHLGNMGCYITVHTSIVIGSDRLSSLGIVLVVDLDVMSCSFVKFKSSRLSFYSLSSAHAVRIHPTYVD